MKLGFFGCGNMGQAMAIAVANSDSYKNEDIFVYDLDEEKCNFMEKNYSCTIASSGKDLVNSADMIVLALKPNVYESAIGEIKEEIRDKVLISIAPSYTIRGLKKFTSKGQKIIRVMPNTPAQVGAGMLGVSFSEEIDGGDREAALEFLNCCGRAEEIDESLMPTITSISGSSPAFCYMFIEAMMEAGIKLGMTRDQALRFSAQTVYGCAKTVLETGKSPADLRDAVSSAGGTTIQGVCQLEKNGFKGNVISALEKSYEKAKSMEEEAQEQYN